MRIPLADARPFTRRLLVARVLRLGLAAAIAALAVAALVLSLDRDRETGSFLPSDAGGVLVLDVSTSIGRDTHSQIAGVLRDAARSGERLGLVVYSDTAYEALPPETPSAELGRFVRFFGDDAPAGRFGQPLTPWVRAFTSGTKISTGLELARTVLRRDGIDKGSVVLVSDLQDDQNDVGTLDRDADLVPPRGNPAARRGALAGPARQAALRRAAAARLRRRRRGAGSVGVGTAHRADGGARRADRRRPARAPRARGERARQRAARLEADVRPVRVAVAVVLLALAALLAVLGEDVRRWPGRVEAGDLRLAAGATTPGLWEPDDALPLRVGAARMGLEDDVRYRESLRLVGVTRLPALTLDAAEVRRRQSRAEHALAQVQDGDGDRSRRSAAATMRGVLLYQDALGTGSRSTELLPKSVAAMRSAIELDPENADAKLNLELLYNLQPPRQRRDRAGGGGGSTGGASYSGPGQGY